MGTRETSYLGISAGEWRRVMLGAHRAVVPQQWKTADAAARGTRQDTEKIQPEVP